ncbi:MAG: ParB/RepB/Spo0J family partition protein [Burkholderiaceae bacterium]|nr:ParB/RepB/Spo0J family partition protein [Burkholderiaceae bacterium]
MTNKKKKGLGRGLDALLGAAPDFTGGADDLSSLPIVLLQAGKYQPRSRMDEGALNELAQSIREQGVLQPLLVRRIGQKDGVGRYEIIAGERRYRAAQQAGLDHVPVRILEVDDQGAAVIALIENLQREDLNPLEEAQGIHRLITEFAYTHEQAADRVGRSRSAVTNLLRLLNLATPVQVMLKAGDIDMGHARALLAAEGAIQIMLANQVVEKRLSVRETEKLVSRELSEKPAFDRKREKTKAADIVHLEEELSDLLATRVSFRVNARGRGQMLIDFANLDVLDGVIQRLRPSA